VLDPEINPVNPYVVNGVMVLLTVGLTFLTHAYQRWRKKAEQKLEESVAILKEVQKQLLAVHGHLQTLDMVVQPLNAAYAAMLVKQLTHFDAPGTDVLLAKVGPPNTLSIDEELELGRLMKERSENISEEIPPLERNAADLLPFVMWRSRLEASNGEQELVPLLVGVPKAHE
jgi:hypothetical protein